MSIHSWYSVPASGEIRYAGAAPGLVNGLIQINFRLPDLIPSPTFWGVIPAFSIDGGDAINTGVVISVKRD